MRRKPITSAEQFAELFEVERDSGPWNSWITRYQIDPRIWIDVLDRYPKLVDVVAMSDALPDAIVGRIARWPYWNYRRWMAWRDNLPASAKSSLLVDVSPDVRSEVARHPSITHEELLLLHAGYEQVSFEEAGKVLRERFGVSWRDLPKRRAPIRRAPYESPDDFLGLLADLGHGALDPEHPDATDDWFDAIARSPELPNWIAYSGVTQEGMFEKLAEGYTWELRSTAAMSPHCPIHVLAALAFDSDEVVRESVASNPFADLPTLLLLASDDFWDPRDTARKYLLLRFGVILRSDQVLPVPLPGDFAAIPGLSEFAQLRRSAMPLDRARARYGQITEAAMTEIVVGGSELSIDLVRNQTVPNDIVRTVIDKNEADSNERIRHVVATTFLGRPELAKSLATHSDAQIRDMIAMLQNTPFEVLIELAGDVKETVQWSAEWSLHFRFGHPYERGRRAPLPRTKSSMQFIALCRSDDPLDREKATTQHAAYPGLWREVLKRAPELAKWVAINETVGPHLLDELADWPDSEVRKWVSDHPRVWLKTLNRLAVDADPTVRRRSVYNARLSNQMLGRLRHDADPEVAAEASRRLAARAYVDRLLSDPEWWRHLGRSEIE